MNTKSFLVTFLLSAMAWSGAEAQSITGSSIYGAAGGARILSVQGNTATNPAIGFQSTVSNAATAQNDGGGGNGIFRPLANNMAFATLGLERMRLSQSGYLGIGTTAPSAILHTSGTVRFQGLTTNTTNTNILTTDVNGNVANRTLASLGMWSLLGNTATTSANFLGTSDAQPLNFRTTNTQRMTILANGNVGIGTAAPTGLLNVVGASNPNIKLSSTGNSNLSIGIATCAGCFSTFAAVGDVVFKPENNTNQVIFTTNSTAGSGGTRKFVFENLSEQIMQIHNAGKVQIGNVTMPGDYRLYVEKGILTEKVKVAVATSTNWADYVFAPNYKLAPLSEVETYIKANKHLPNVPSADELVKDGLDLGTMQAKQMEKIEELTLYMIEMKKEIEQLKKDNAALKSSSSPSKN